ncbi:hypothetical protein [Corynebacterium freneyi]|uniref:F0F1-type ATP synthase assembly protein I n=1 Tax=Corynebacterium freneyi TaxID=134034 RepID=A0ABS4U8M4_9CORY|nr:hypothetical protein [Corynebacterium freneyi]MBP2333014.1 F0F1-type ATP synthase assembly protein I [Corynebacterium freneyi]QXA52886.1 hypothetical protein I6L56_00105 [Corynebacterium freneyi]WJZ04884.1 hypothetical protein CFREN_04530 [Corynebacterium freneyi]
MTDATPTDHDATATTAGAGAHAPHTPQSDANPATATSTAYSVRIVAGVLLIVVFGGLPTVVDGRPLWAAIVGLIGVIAGAILIALAINSMIRERRARNLAARR